MTNENNEIVPANPEADNVQLRYLGRLVGERLSTIPPTQVEQAIEILRQTIEALNQLNQNETQNSGIARRQAITDDTYVLSEEDRAYEKGLKAFYQLIKLFKKSKESSTEGEKEEIESRANYFFEKIDRETFYQMFGIFQDEFKTRIKLISSSAEKIFEAEGDEIEKARGEIEINLYEMESLLDFWFTSDESKDTFFNNKGLKSLLDQIRTILENKNISFRDLSMAIAKFKVESKDFNISWEGDRGFVKNIWKDKLRDINFRDKERFFIGYVREGENYKTIILTPEEKAKELFLNIKSVAYYSAYGYRAGRIEYLKYREFLKANFPEVFELVKTEISKDLKIIFSEILENGEVDESRATQLNKRFRVILGVDSSIYKEVSSEIYKCVEEKDSSSFDFNSRIDKIKKIINDAALRGEFF